MPGLGPGVGAGAGGPIGAGTTPAAGGPNGACTTPAGPGGVKAAPCGGNTAAWVGAPGGVNVRLLPRLGAATLLPWLVPKMPELPGSATLPLLLWAAGSLTTSGLESGWCEGTVGAVR